MSRAYFIFTKYANSFSVRVKNLEELSVEQIQEIQSFVSARKGVFDFNNYIFSIQKKIEFEEFCKLIERSSIDAYSVENIIESKFQARVGFGQYKGMYYSELPDSYMLWLKNNYRGQERDTIDEELNKRKL
ncbi:MAG: DUF3820 family protein [Campylobacterota bacterium]|nr:DUF3820 family protein [Campylobacterota bacterium]